MSVSSWELSKPRPAEERRHAPVVPPGPEISVILEAPDRIGLKIRAEQPFTLLLPRIFFPGWRVAIDGEGVPVQPNGKFALVSVGAPAGEHLVTAQLGPTAAGLLGTIATVVCLFAFLLALRRAPRPAVFAGAGALLLVVALGIATYEGRSRAHQPATLSVTISDQIRLLGRTLPEKPFAPGDTLSVRLYWLALTSPEQDYKVFLHLIRPDDSGPVAQSDSEPNLGYRPMTSWTPGELVVDEQWLALPTDLTPGRYRLLAGVYRPDTVENLIAAGQGEILPGDRIVLADIEVRAKDGGR
jgi:hypothetical protein